MISSHRAIAWNYFTGYLLIDVAATFPYELVTDNYYTTLFRLLRLTHMEEVLSLVDFQRLQPLIEWFFKNDARGKRVFVTFFFINFF